MKFKLLLLILPLLSIGATALANPALDSIGVENLDGKKVILHKLDPKDSYYSVGRRYNVKPNDIIKFNNNIALRVGAVIKVPTERSVMEPTPQPAPITQQNPPQVQKPAETPKQVQRPVQTSPPAQTPQPAPAQTSITSTASAQQYKVSQGETLFAIARRFNTTVEDIIQLNSLRSNNLTPGQILLVKSGTPAPAPPVVVPVTEMPVTKRDSTLVTPADSVERRLPANRYGLSEKNEKGVATWMDDTSLDANKKLVLHRFAPIGTVIKLTNPMTNRTTFAKVVGRFTDNEANRDVIIVMTKNVADALGALDKRFQVNISYGTPNE
jgi:LysM repeat protein